MGGVAMRFRRGGAIAALALAVILGTTTVASAKPTAKPTKAEKALYNNLPQATYPTCQPSTSVVKKDYAMVYPSAKKAIATIVAAISCSGVAGAGAPDVVVFTKWKTDAAMKSFYTTVRTDFNIQPDSGTGNTCPEEGTVVVNQTQQLGREVCYVDSSNGGSEYVWTIDQLKILANAIKTNDPNGSLISTWWTTGAPGPNVPTSGTSTTPSS